MSGLLNDWTKQHLRPVIYIFCEVELKDLNSWFVQWMWIILVSPQTKTENKWKSTLTLKLSTSLSSLLNSLILNEWGKWSWNEVHFFHLNCGWKHLHQTSATQTLCLICFNLCRTVFLSKIARYIIEQPPLFHLSVFIGGENCLIVLYFILGTNASSHFLCVMLELFCACSAHELRITRGEQ